MENLNEIKHYKEVHSFYFFVGIIALSIIVLQPLAMLLVMFIQAGMQ